MFIHPDIKQLRSITIREAALLQSFPMDFEFIGSNAYCFKIIGNAVPVSFAKEIAHAIIDVLKRK
jgi:DNA (cytosine-5)-methyltransferase 1